MHFKIIVFLDTLSLSSPESSIVIAYQFPCTVINLAPCAFDCLDFLFLESCLFIIGFSLDDLQIKHSAHQNAEKDNIGDNNSKKA